ncbi:oxygenase MpaB family protein [Noviherbaspirillum massiliense]|uniref:oxygenase MpaB family protein n=1 Tax=Noviherbaspirillum massiliense TaxID=1465823 RepID=UPI0002EBF650|nr:oxygenase MpaB family protein [Noviherbaspirillum massiliense]
MTRASTALELPAMLQRRLEAAACTLVYAGTASARDFAEPAREPALVAPDSVSWQVFKNPLSLFIGGVAAVILELAEPRVRTGVWEHTSFRKAPLPRLQRTGLAAMMTVYGPRSRTEAMIAGVNRLHARIAGTTPEGEAYRADHQELLDWVHATASFGFLEAWSAYAHPLGEAERDRYYAEGRASAQLYGAHGAPASQRELEALFAAMRGKLAPSPIVFEFLGIMQGAAILPPPLNLIQGWLVKAAVDIVPVWVRERLGLDAQWTLHPWQRRQIRQSGAWADRILLRSAPAVQACRRLGLPDDYLYTQGRA